MAERKPLVPLVASVRGFYNGRMVEPGSTFMFDPNPKVPGGTVKWPKWAAPAGQQAEKVSKADRVGDIRPADAVKAAKAKAGGITGML